MPSRGESSELQKSSSFPWLTTYGELCPLSQLLANFYKALLSLLPLCSSLFISVRIGYRYRLSSSSPFIRIHTPPPTPANMVQNKSLVYKQVPTGLPEMGKHMVIETSEIDLDAKLEDGSILVKELWQSVDPYMRGRLREPGTKSCVEAGK